jgi:hypothetical protein
VEAVHAGAVRLELGLVVFGLVLLLADDQRHDDVLGDGAAASASPAAGYDRPHDHHGAAGASTAA